VEVKPVNVSDLSWFAIRVKSQCEKMVSDALRYKGYEEFLPLYWSRRRWSDRIKVIQLPLFAGYLFCRFDLVHRSSILTIPGVCHVVGQGRVPLPVETGEVERIRLAVSSGQNIEPWRGLEVGNTVRIENGPLRGIEGMLLRFKGSNHLILGVQLLQRSVAVEVDENWVMPSTSRGPYIDTPQITKKNDNSSLSMRTTALNSALQN
jgi:transcription antitermination factor NusG